MKGPASDSPPETRLNKADLVADVLRHEIAIGIYPAGSELPSEGRLSARFGVSRPSSREALRVLESEGLIRVARGARGGAKVLLPSLDSISRYLGIYLQMREVKMTDLYGALLAYEPLAARSIAQRRDPAALSALAACVAAQQFSTHDRDEYRKHEREFRSLLLLHSGNEVIRLMGSLLTEVYERSLAAITRNIGPVVWEREHLTSGVVAKQRLMQLMADGEEDQAARTWKAYLFTYWRRVRAHVGEGGRIKYYSEDAPPPSPSEAAGRAVETAPPEEVE